MKKEYRNYSQEDIASLKDGVYFREYDPNMETDFWPPNDEEIKIFGNRINSSGIWCINAICSRLTFIRDLTKDEIKNLRK